MSERYRYHCYKEPDLAPPHGIWDTVLDQPAGPGSYQTKSYAETVASAMNEADGTAKRELAPYVAAVEALGLALRLHANRSQ